ncbi:DUF1707 SHOCT-like domain-containing protein [Nocardia takedensis]
MSTTSSGRIRARDLDRANAAAVLDAAYAEGQLGAAEYHERAARAAAARTLGELDGLVADLQSPTAVTDLTAAKGRAGSAARDSASTSRNPLTRRRFSAGYPEHTRARDADRAETVRALDAARADGQLTADEHTAATELAAEARTLGELAELVADLQRRADAAPPPSRPRGRGKVLVPALIAVAAAVALVGAFALTAAEDAPPLPPRVPSIEVAAVEPLVLPTPDLTTAEGLTLFLDRYRDAFGDTLVDEVRFDTHYVSITRASPDLPNRAIRYDYRGGFKRSPGGANVPRRPGFTPVDMATLDIAALAPVIADAPAASKVPDGSVSSIEFDMSDVGPFAGRPTVQISVRNDREQYADVIAAPDGTVLRVTEVR